MLNLKIVFTFLAFCFISCKEKKVKQKANSIAINLNNSSMELVKYISNIDSSQKAIRLLDSATNFDKNYYMGYFNKLMFLNRLKQYDKAIVATGNLIRLKPNAHDLYIINGVFYEKINDTVSSNDFFQKSLKICNQILDTMSSNKNNYEMIVMNKAVNLIMLNKNNESNDLLKKLMEIQTNPEMKKIAASMIGINKGQLIELYYSDKRKD